MSGSIYSTAVAPGVGVGFGRPPHRKYSKSERIPERIKWSNRHDTETFFLQLFSTTFVGKWKAQQSIGHFSHGSMLCTATRLQINSHNVLQSDFQTQFIKMRFQLQIKAADYFEPEAGGKTDA